MKKFFFATLLIIINILFSSTFTALANNALTQKEKDIVLISSYGAKGELFNLETALNKALDDKMTIYEIKEILVQIYPYCGFPRSINAITTCMKVTDERSAKGIYDSYGTEPVELNSDANKYEIGASIQTELTGVPITGRIYEFEPAIDKFLKEHLFADIFSRGVLSYKERELATIAVLSSMDGVEPQLKAHIQVGQNLGISKEKIDEIINLTQQKKFENEIFERGERNNVYAQYFKGQSYLNILNKEGAQTTVVTFEPGCRNNWHIHHKGGQLLIVTQGKGYYQQWGETPKKLKSGDVVYIAPEIKHWHGASKDSWFVHIAIELPAKNSSTEWLEPVSDEEYNKLK